MARTRDLRSSRPRRSVSTDSAPGAPDAAASRVSWACALLALAVYLAQAPPVSGDKDSSEFTLVLALNGVAHPTGYPLYTLFGHLFVRALHGLGLSWPYAANAWSAVGGAVAVFFLHALASRLMAGSRPPHRGAATLLALVPIAWFALNPIWTIETGLGEVNSWHVAWAMAISYVFAGWMRSAARGAGPMPRLDRGAFLWGVLCGIGGAHHVTAIFEAVPFSIALGVVLRRRGWLRARHVGLVLAGAVLPLLSYGIVLWRASHPAPVQWPTLLPGWRGLWLHVTGAQYQFRLGRFTPSAEQQRLLAWYVWPLLGAGLAALGAAFGQARKGDDRVLYATLSMAAGIGTAYAFLYGVDDPSSYFLTPMALGAAVLAPLLAHRLARQPGLAPVAIALGVALLGLNAWWIHVTAERRSVYVRFDALVRQMWSAIPKGRGIVSWPDDMSHRLREYQLLGGDKPELEVINPWTLLTGAPREAFARRHGFDPAEGLPLPRDLRDPAMAQAIETFEKRVNQGTPLPVYHFDPEVPTVRLLRKHGDVPRDSSAAVAR
jgi:hypothetical protein